MRSGLKAALAQILGFTILVQGGVARADMTQGGTTIGVSVELAGFATPSRYYSNPCNRGPDYAYTDYVRGELNPPAYFDEDYTVIFSSAGDRESQAMATWHSPAPATVSTAKYTYFFRYCRDPRRVMIDRDTYELFLVPLVGHDTVVPALYDSIWDYVRSPAVSWPSADHEFGWLYVQSPMDFRLEQIAPVSVTASVTNVTGSVTATVTATPIGVILEPGEPGAAAVECPIESARARYEPSSPGLCSYTYHHSTAVSPDGMFRAVAGVRWTVTTTSATFPVSEITTWATAPVVVAEAQAVVTQ